MHLPTNDCVTGTYYYFLMMVIFCYPTRLFIQQLQLIFTPFEFQNKLTHSLAHSFIIRQQKWSVVQCADDGEYKLIYRLKKRHNKNHWNIKKEGKKWNEHKTVSSLFSRVCVLEQNKWKSAVCGKCFHVYACVSILLYLLFGHLFENRICLRY